MARARIRLDETDHRILSLLTQDAGLKNKDLAKRVGVAPSTCLARVRRLEQNGFIVGYRAVVTRSGLGARLEGWADIRFRHVTPELTREFGRLVEAAPEIVEAHRIAGRADYVVRFCGGDMAAWNSFRESLDALGCDAEAQFNLLVEAVK
ncbi:MAG: Lrp/AsnC family transcriptional regulator [Hyphomonadaceae bacterium]|nr:Lrp/AsnC family transcriptional regulator [Hyphomonadaceae bacterium]